jgi:hypothetical protein
MSATFANKNKSQTSNIADLAGKDDIESALAIMVVDVFQDVIIKLGPVIGAKVMKDENKVVRKQTNTPS